MKDMLKTLTASDAAERMFSMRQFTMTDKKKKPEVFDGVFKKLQRYDNLESPQILNRGLLNPIETRPLIQNKMNSTNQPERSP
jgi:hypothetical protein